MVLPQYNQTQGIITQNNKYKAVINKLVYKPISTPVSGISTINQFSQVDKPTLTACLLCWMDMVQEGSVVKYADHIMQLAQIRFAAPI